MKGEGARSTGGQPSGMYSGAHGMTEEVSDPGPLLDHGCQSGPSNVQDLQLLLYFAQLGLQRSLEGEEVVSFGRQQPVCNICFLQNDNP